MIFRIFKFFILFIFISILILLSSSIYVYQKYLKPEKLKTYLITTLSQKTGLNTSFSDLEFIPPDNIVIYNLNLSGPKCNISIGKLGVNIKLYKLLPYKKGKISIERINLEDAKIDIDIETSTDSIPLNIDFKSFPKVVANNIDLSFKNHSFYHANIKNLRYEKDFILDNKVKIDSILNLQTPVIKNLPLELSLKLDIIDNKISAIELEKLITIIDNNPLKINGNIILNANTSNLTISTSKELELKKILKIPYDIKIDKFTTNLNINYSSNTIKLNSYIKEINSAVSLIYDIGGKKIKRFYLNAKNIDTKKISDILDKHIKNSNGKIDLELTLENTDSRNILRINSRTSNLSFSDPFDIMRFSGTEAKLIINPKFYALNATRLEGTILKKTLRGWMKVDSDYTNENILLSLTIDTTKIDSKIRIKNIYKDKKFMFDISVSKFDFDFISKILEYVVEKLEKKPSDPKSKYYMINKPVIINLKSDKVILKDYLKANSLKSRGDIKKFNRYHDMVGEFKIVLYNGVMENITKNLEKDEVYKLAFIPINTIFELNRTGALKIDSKLNSIHFSEMGINFSLNNAKIIIDKFYLNSDEFYIYSKGMIDTENKKLDMKAYIINRKDYKRGTLPETLSDTKGRPAIAFKVKGDFKNTEVKLLDLTNITEIVEKEIKEGIKID